MHDVNPVGQLMHLKEIERQVALARHPVLPSSGTARRLGLRAIMAAVLRRLGAYPHERRRHHCECAVDSACHRR